MQDLVENFFALSDSIEWVFKNWTRPSRFWTKINVSHRKSINTLWNYRTKRVKNVVSWQNYNCPVGVALSRVDMSLNWARFSLHFSSKKLLQPDILELISSRLFLGCKIRSNTFLPYWQFFLLGIIINLQGNFSIASIWLHEIHMCGLWVKHSCLQNDSCFLFPKLRLDIKVY